MPRTCDENFLTKMKQEAKILNNIGFILEKIDEDGFLASLQDIFGMMINNETQFVIKELKKHEYELKKSGVRAQLINNTYIFKENLKLISNFLSSLKSRHRLEGKGEGQYFGLCGRNSKDFLQRKQLFRRNPPD